MNRTVALIHLKDARGSPQQVSMATAYEMAIVGLGFHAVFEMWELQMHRAVRTFADKHLSHADRLAFLAETGVPLVEPLEQERIAVNAARAALHLPSTVDPNLLTMDALLNAHQANVA